jgi:hypothetical protein
VRLVPACTCGLSLVFGLAIAHAAARLNETSVRAFIVTQDQAWEHRDFARYYSTFNANAVIIAVQMHDGVEMSRSLRTVANDRQQMRRFFAAHPSPIRETDMIESIFINRDGNRAVVRVKEVAEIRKGGRRKTLRATTEQNLALYSGRIVSLNLTEYNER